MHLKLFFHLGRVTLFDIRFAVDVDGVHSGLDLDIARSRLSDFPRSNRDVVLTELRPFCVIDIVEFVPTIPISFAV